MVSRLSKVGVSLVSLDFTAQVSLALNANRSLHTDAFGADCCGGPQGCCGSCFDSSFNDDNFDARAKNAQAHNSADAEPVNSQPVPSQDMSTTVTGDQKPTNVSED